VLRPIFTNFIVISLVEMNSFGIDKAVTFRYPATANLMVDSQNRDVARYPSPFDFQITKPQNSQNGFFTRVGVTEVVLDWNEGNLDGQELQVDISGVSVRSTSTITFFGFGTVAFVLDSIADLSGTNGVGLAVEQVGGTWGISATNGDIKILSTPLSEDLGIQILPTLLPRVTIVGPTDLRQYYYIDIVSPSLTYAQDLKDNSTADIERDVLVRWYFAEDTPENLDKYGFPILMGYTYFSRRRLYNPPKQIKWDNNLPLGNLVFQVYDDNGMLLEPSDPTYTSEFYLTLQLSEN
jgi:hypothetical protein